LGSLRERFRELYFRSRVFRLAAAKLIDDKPAPIDYSHLLSYSDVQIGPVQRDEALALYGLTRILRPQTVVEFGFQNGHSALNFLLAAGPDCKVFSYDINPWSKDVAQRCLGRFRNFRFIGKSQADFTPSDIDHREIDLCFIDASHDLALNLKTFELILPSLAGMAAIVIHDTGIWQKRFFRENHRAFVESANGKAVGRWIDDEQYQPCVDERLFVNTLLQIHADFSQIHLHSTRALRNGLTLLQRTSPLPTEPHSAEKCRAPLGSTATELR
jgi:predicted O-methyltransferase YrrM